MPCGGALGDVTGGEGERRGEGPLLVRSTLCNQESEIRQSYKVRAAFRGSQNGIITDLQN